MIDRKRALRQLYFSEIKRLPNNFYDGISQREMGFLVKYVLEDLAHLTIDDMVTFTRGDLYRYGLFGVIRNGSTFEVSNAYEVLRLGFPDIRPWMMYHKHIGFFDVKENIFETLEYNVGRRTDLTLREVREHVYGGAVRKFFDGIEDLKNQYGDWLEAKQSNKLKGLNTLEIYKGVLTGKRYPANFWDNLSDEELSLIVRYGLEIVLKMEYSEQLFEELSSLDFESIRLGRLDKEFITKSGVKITDRYKLIEFVYMREF